MIPSGSTRALAATRVSDDVPRAIASGEVGLAQVHSVFRTALNVITEHGLITIADERGGGLPRGILVAQGVEFHRAGVEPGMPVSVDPEALKIPAAALMVTFGDAPSWSPRMPVMVGASWSARSALAHAHLDAAANRVGGGLRSIPVARGLLADCGAALASGDRARAARAARSLTGLGPGLTPSGDDALVGLEAALHAVGHPAAGFVDDLLADVDTLTTTVSAALLRHAANGDFSERLHRLLGALLVGPTNEMPEAIEQAAAWGATSGLDGIDGVLTGLDAAVQRRRAGERRQAVA